VRSPACEVWPLDHFGASACAVTAELSFVATTLASDQPRAITEIAERAAQMFLAEQARQFLDCAINLCATSMPIPALVKLLEDHAEMLREFG
jgi:hypothetical protein